MFLPRIDGEKAASEYRDIFGKDGSSSKSIRLEKRARSFPNAEIGQRTGIRVAATNDCHYMQQDDSRAHDILLCIQTGKTVNDPNRMKFYTDQFYFKSRQDMDQVFGEIPSVLDQTVEIADRCNLKLKPVANPFPEFVVPPGFTIDTYFAKVVSDGFQDRLAYLKPLADRGMLKNDLPIRARLEQEIKIIRA
jgi:DNA polymerase-3 subunit alpha